MSESDLAEVISAFNDVTSKLHSSHEALRREVSRLQAQLREANEQIERSRRLAALGEMAAGIAHEVRNPLGSIRLYAKMLEDDLSQMPEQRLLATKIGGAVRTVDAVVRDVLSFAREERAKFEEVDVRELIERVVDEVLDADRSDRGAMAQRINVDVRGLEAAPTLSFSCDPVLAQRALGNIVSNAVQAMREQCASGRLGPMTLTIDISPRRGEDERALVIAVGDTGGGIAPDVMERMFNPFFTTRATGTGLGLAIVHRIMEAHGGGVVVRNRRADGDVGCGAGAVVELGFPERSEGRRWSAVHAESGESLVITAQSREPGSTTSQGLLGRVKKSRKSGRGQAVA